MTTKYRSTILYDMLVDYMLSSVP